MLDENRIEKLVKEVAKKQLAEVEQMTASGHNSREPLNHPANSHLNNVTKEDYPLTVKRPEWVKSSTGKSLSNITIEKVLDGQVQAEDVRISEDVLRLQAQIAEDNGKKQFALNLRRAAEMTRIPDEKVLEIYEMMRPRRATKQQLLDVANELENSYQAAITAKLVREAAEIYEKRGILK